jgi:acyl-coenzyme A thioesterase PaaI-like protein
MSTCDTEAAGIDTTALARRLLAPVPIHQTIQLEVISAVNGRAEVRMADAAGLTSPAGALHSSGLITLIDAAGLAALISAAEADDAFTNVSLLGAAASLEFLRPALGPLTAVCQLDPDACAAMRPLFARTTDKVSVSTSAQVLDADGVVVCQGGFRWSVRRRP